MRSNDRRTQTWNAVGAMSLLALTLGTAQAAIPATTPHHFSSHPMISGTVVTVNDRAMVVNTDQGEQVTLQVDSRTMAPRDLAPGMVMRAEFLALEDCRFYVQRVMPIRGGMSTTRTQAYAHTSDSPETIERNASAFGGMRREYVVSSSRVGSRETGPQTMSDHSPGAVMTAGPATADNGFSTRPLLSGTVVSVNDHRIILNTDQGQQVALLMDSRTLVPGEIAPGSVMRADFSQMKDGRYYANRISRIGNAVADREQAYAHTHDSELLLAQNTPDCGFVSIAAASPVTAAVEPRPVVPTPEPIVTSAPAPVAELPQTASHQPLLLLLGLLALGSAGVVTVLRGQRTV